MFFTQDAERDGAVSIRLRRYAYVRLIFYTLLILRAMLLRYAAFAIHAPLHYFRHFD